MPIIHRVMDAEQAHHFAIQMAKYRLVPFAKRFEDDQILVGTFDISTRLILSNKITFYFVVQMKNVKVFDKRFDNPIGCAAGFDKNAEALEGLFQVGFGFVEVGTITPRAQSGNEKPRVFRLAEDVAIINRYFHHVFVVLAVDLAIID